ncbi:MAG TPA: Hsp20/alpha crystallin family protein [Polyangiaceae bacterium]|nr:Hsp20/alpha crystallin family protein [Polyangiaceae bacterium]
MSFFNLTRAKEDKPAMQPQTNEAQVSGTRARQVPLPVDIYEGQEELLLMADLPGVEAQGLTVSFEAPELRIEGRRGSGADERVYSRTFRVSEQIDPNGISAELAAGVLKLRLAKAAHTKPRKIEVRTG